METTVFNVLFKAKRLGYVLDEQTGFGATYVMALELYDEFEPLTDYSFNTFSVTGATEPFDEY